MKISRVEATTHNIPIDVPLLPDKMWRPIVVASVETDEGITGFGLTGHLQRFGVRDFINKELAPFLVGRNPLETERIGHQLARTFNPRAQTGVFSSALSAVDIALWDIKGKRHNEPVWRLLGGARNPARAYVTFGLLDYDRDQLVQMATRLAGEGQPRLKLVVGIDGGENPLEDAARVRAVREAVGDDVDLMVDANYTFSLARAKELCRLIERLSHHVVRGATLPKRRAVAGAVAAFNRHPHLGRAE